MRIDPALMALRSNPATQRQAQTALENARDGWRADARVAEVLRQLPAYGAGRPLEDCPDLAAIFSDVDAARAFLHPLMHSMIGELAQYPLGHVPLRHQYNGGVSVLLLAQAREATISLLTYEKQESISAPESVCFSDGDRIEIVLAGSADLTIYTLVDDLSQAAQLEAEARSVGLGASLTFRSSRQTKFVERVHGQLTVLRLARTSPMPSDSREFRLSDGTLLHRASGNRGESRHELMMAVLGRMGRRDAAPVLAEMSIEGSDHLRWQALRQCLALDTARGFATLCRFACDAADSLHAPASTLRAQLLEAHPQLAGLEDA